MKFNNAKYLIIILGIAGLFTSSISNAFWVRPDVSKWCRSNHFPNCSDYPFQSSDLYFVSAGTNYDDLNTLNYLVGNGYSVGYESYNYNQGKYYTIATTGTTNVRTGNLQTYNDGDFLVWRFRRNSGTVYYGYSTFQFNFINSYKDGDSPVFAWWYDEAKKYNSISYYSLPSLPSIDGTGDNYYFVQPWHGSWIFYNYLYDKDLKTIQYIGNQVLVDKFIYVDTLAQSDNVWLVDTKLNKARSMTESDPFVLSQFLFGGFKFTDELLNNAGWTDSYNVIMNPSGNSFLPQTYGNFMPAVNTNGNTDILGYIQGMKSYKGANIGITYDKDFEFTPPDFSDGNNNTGNSHNDSVLSYEQCLIEYKPIQTLSELMYSCYSNYSNNDSDNGEEFFEMLNYVNTLPYYKENDLTYTGYKPLNIFSSCSRWLDNAEMIYQNHTGNNYYEIVNTAVSYGYTNSFDIEHYCGTYPQQGSTDSWLCRMTGVGCDLSFGNIYDNVKENIKPFITEPIDEVIREFDRGYNFIGSGNNSCIEPYGKTYIWGNYFIIVLVGGIVIFLYGIFKE